MVLEVLQAKLFISDVFVIEFEESAREMIDKNQKKHKQSFHP